MQNFEGKVAVITGAASGIGRGLTEKCLAEGMHVVMADIEEDVLNKAAEELQADGKNNILTVKTDVSVLEEIEQLAQKAINHFGAVHVLFNNAGVGGGGNAWESSQKDWEWVIGVNLWSVIHGLRVFIPHMIEQGDDCHIVIVSNRRGTDEPELRFRPGCRPGRSGRGEPQSDEYPERHRRRRISTDL